ncbi:peptidase M23 [Clostridium perfringens]|uniref:phage tail spike protein n=1 Tax=Clostridium perfringens TaxID=1502 RepID=UPI0013D88A81|nr:phage tail spike protein [Clostridium perfringens]EIF6153529.1 peptidoglycan DD-metalloendopeptidase family protein [Clostridium perfringens]KAF2784479.1 peptidase M23 [Clostridium perfringens]MCX0382072.1 peptidoglycan DD-metalloendopeptidase family protein [Clostridium perfringens]MCX0416313.1 peptidoglycan DD-metalloendopeptidase family protein [Clostridium perfringens]
MQYYKIDNYNFTKNGDITLQPIDGKLRVELNTGLCEVEVELPYDKEKRWTKLEEWGVIKTDVFYSKNKQLFRIYNTDKGMFSLKIKARHIFFDLVKHNLLDTRAVECTGQQALDKILEGSKYKGHSDIGRITTSYFQVTNIVQALNGENDNTFRNRWGGEMLFDNFDIYINNKIGGDYGVRVNYSRNMEDVNLIIDRDNIVTRAYPRAFDGIMLPEKYIDSPLINKYPIVCEDYIDMSDLKLKDPNTSNDEGFDTEEELYQAMRERMKKLYEGGIDKPRVSGNVKVAMLENSIEYKDFKGLVNIGIGDTVTVNHKDIDIDMKTRAITIEWNLVTKKYENVEFGDVEVNYFAKQDIAREQLDNILNKNGTVNAGEMEGIINAMQTKFKALRDVAQPQHQLGMLFEDKIKGSKTYGAMAIGSMGFMIASERTLDDKDWNWKTFGSGQGFFADWLVGKLRTVLIENMDGSFQMDLNKPGGMTFKNNSIKAMLIENNALKMFNWKKDGQYIGGLTSLLLGSNEKQPLVGLTNSNDSAISIGYEESGNTRIVPPYIQFDKYNILKDKNEKPIRIFEEVDFKGNKLYNVDISSINKKHTLKVGEDFINIGNEKCELVISENGIRIGKQNTFYYDANTGEITINAPIKNSNGQVILDPNNFGVGGGGVDTLGNVSKGIPSRKYFRYVKGIEGLQQYPGNIGDGEITYGYGVTKSNEPTYFAKLGAAPCSEETASRVLFELIPDKYGSLVKNQMLKDGIDLSKVPINVFDAFVDLTYNSGRYNSSLYRDWVNGVSPKIIYNKWLSYIIMPGSIFEDGLKRRRKEEAEMFLNANYMMSSIGILNAHGGQIGTVKGDGYFPSITSNFKTVSNDYGNWILPVTGGSITALFGHYPSGAKHTGTDIGVPEGTPVRACKDGVVIKRRELTYSYGKYLQIDHGGGLTTIYGHNSQLLVNEGDHVKQGQVIALSGSTGNSTGNHSHIELRYNGTPVNFAPSLRIGQVV